MEALTPGQTGGETAVAHRVNEVCCAGAPVPAVRRADWELVPGWEPRRFPEGLMGQLRPGG